VSAGVYLAIAVAGLVLVAFSSGVETGAYAVNRARLRLNVASGDPRARRLQALVSDLPSLLIAVLVGRAGAHALVSFAVTLLLHRYLQHGAELVATAAVAPVVFVLGELGPKELFRRHADRFMTYSAPLLAVFERLLTPVTRLFAAVSALLRRRAHGPTPEEDRALAAEELRLTIQASAEEGVLTDFQAALARNILTLRHRRVVSAMVPLARVYALEVSTPLAAAREIAGRAGRSHLPVYRGKPEEAIGSVHLYDLFLSGDDKKTLESLVRAAPRLSPNDRVEDALLRLRMAREQLAIVGGPDGKAVGIVTLKDLCEEITGELEDL
jgi:CBS domain containing-hemolysin-like protein